MTPQPPQPADDGLGPWRHGQPNTPGTVVTEPKAPVGRLPGQPIDTAALQANLDAIAAACRTPGLTWQQIAAIQAGLDFSSPWAAASAIKAANAPGGGAPGGLPRVPTAEELAKAAAQGQAYASTLLQLVASMKAAIGPNMP